MKERINNDKIIDSFDFGIDSDVVSDTEVTGLIPSLPNDDYEIESYKNIDMYQQRPIPKQQQEPL